MFKIISLKKNYGTHLALDDISFEIEKGEVTALIGRNGAGKSTLLGILAGSINRSGGKVLLGEADHFKDFNPVIAPIGIQLENSAFYPHLNIKNNLSFLEKLKGIKESDLDKILSKLELQNNRKKFTALSQGMKKRVSIASALCGRPQLLLFDEPTVNLDPEGIFLFYNIIRELKTEGKSIIISSHLLTDISEIADRIILLDRGKKILDLPKDQAIVPKNIIIKTAYLQQSWKLLKDFYKNHDISVQDEFITIDFKNVNLEELTKMLVHHELPPREVYIEKTSLKDIFSKYHENHSNH